MSWMTPRAKNSVQKSLPKSNSAMLVSSRSGNANPAIATTSHTTKFSTTSATVASAHCRTSPASSRQLSAA